MNYYHDLITICDNPQVHIAASQIRYDNVWPRFCQIYAMQPYVINTILQLQQIKDRANLMQKNMGQDMKAVLYPDIYKECRDICATLSAAQNPIVTKADVNFILENPDEYEPIDLLDAYRHAME